MKYGRSHIFVGGGTEPDPRLSAVASNTYWFHKQLYKIKYKSGINFCEQIFAIFSESKNRIKMGVLKTVDDIKHQQSEQNACKIWTESDNNFAVKMIFF